MPTEDEYRARIAKLEAAESERAKAAAVSRELSRFEFASAAAAQQVCDLITPTVQATPLSDGRLLVHDKDYTPLDTLVSRRLGQPDHAHFLKATQAAAPPAAGTQAAPPAVPTPGQLRPGQVLGSMLGMGAREAMPGESLGAAMIRVAQAQKGPQGDPRLDIGLPLGIGPRRLQPK
jgi:hypothetical protein